MLYNKALRMHSLSVYLRAAAATEEKWGAKVDTVLRETFGFSAFRQSQRDAIISLLSGIGFIGILIVVVVVVAFIAPDSGKGGTFSC